MYDILYKEIPNKELITKYIYNIIEIEYDFLFIATSGCIRFNVLNREFSAKYIRVWMLYAWFCEAVFNGNICTATQYIRGTFCATQHEVPMKNIGIKSNNINVW